MTAHDILISLYRGAREVPADAFIDWALSLLKTVVPFDMGRWGVGVQSADGFSFPVNHLFHDEPEIGRHYDEIRQQDTAASWVGAHRHQTGNFNAQAFYSAPEQAGIRAYVKRFRHEHALITADIGPSGVGRTISLYGAMPKRPFAEHERQAMEWLFPHLLEAWSINQALHAEKLRVTPQACHWVIVVTDPAGYLHFIEPGALALLNEEWPGMRSDRLPEASMPELAGSRPFDGARIVIVPSSVGRMLFLKVRARTVVDCLTPRERTIASRIARGLTHKEIARELSLAPATVRNQIQDIHERLDVRNNAQLIAKLMQCRPD
jgi:DNA-binding NarL/FixJ family response regulator